MNKIILSIVAQKKEDIWICLICSSKFLSILELKKHLETTHKLPNLLYNCDEVSPYE
jgi:hypothetical protein